MERKYRINWFCSRISTQHYQKRSSQITKPDQEDKKFCVLYLAVWARKYNINESLGLEVAFKGSEKALQPFRAHFFNGLTTTDKKFGAKFFALNDEVKRSVFAICKAWHKQSFEICEFGNSPMQNVAQISKNSDGKCARGYRLSKYGLFQDY